ncbi:MAG: DsbE family thiol:disulfide interchange protein [Pseudomonadota bacterium]
MARVSPLMLLPPLLFLAIAALFVFGVNRNDPTALQSALVGQNAPVEALPPLTGHPGIDATVFADGEVKLVNFWASWCAPCRIEHPTFMRLAEDGLPIVGINYKDDPDKARAFLAELGDPYVGIGTDPEGRAAFDWGVSAVPETFVIDGDGVVRLRFAGPVTDQIFENIVRPAIESAK